MAYQETTRQSYGSKVKGSFKGILWGIILILAGTVILWWNEGRAVKASDALKDFQKNYVELSDLTTVDPAFEGKAVHATGVANTEDILSDDAFGIAVNALRLARHVEYYQWTEQSESKSKDKLGGATETTTTYTYKPAWCNEPVNSNEFKDPDYKGKNFVWRSIDDTEQDARNVTLGAYKLTEGIVSRISGEEPAYPKLDTAMMARLLTNVNDSTVVVTVNGDQVYIGSDPATPHIGDVKITFTQVTSPKTISLLEKVVNGSFESFVAKNGKSFSRVEMGTVSAENMFENQKQANKILLWVLRIVGILLVIAGNKSLLSFISTVFAVVPFVQKIIGTGVGLVATILGIVWSFIVIAVAWIAHRPVLAIALLVIAAALIVWLVGRSRKKKISDVAAILVLVLALSMSAGCNKNPDTTVTGGEKSEQDLAALFTGPVKTILLTTDYGEGEPAFYEYQFDQKGKLISEKDIDPFAEEREDSDLIEALSEKDAEGRYTKQVYGSDGEVYSIQLTEYSADGQVVKSQYLNGEGEPVSINNYRYDAAGNQTMWENVNPSNNSSYSTVNEYDSQNRRVKSVSSYNGQVSTIETTNYDVDGWDALNQTEWVNLGKTARQYEKHLKDLDETATRRYETDENGTKLTYLDTAFVDAAGLRHHRTYFNYDNEYSYEGTFNKDGYLTHYEFFKGKSTRPAKTLDLEIAPDGETLKRVVLRTQEFGQVQEHDLPQLYEADTFGNWTDRTLGLRWLPDLYYSDDPESVRNWLATQHRTITYYGDDQGQNYRFEGKNGESELILRWTNDLGVICGEAILDGDPVRIVGCKEKVGSDWHIVALQKDGTIPWHLYMDAEGDNRTATIVKGMDEYKFPMTASRKDLKTYNFKAKPDDIVGIYEYKDKGGDTGEGTLNVSRCGDDWEEYQFEVTTCGPAPSYTTASDKFTNSPSETLEFYNYLWDERSDTNFAYKIRFFDDFAVILRESGSPAAIFGMGVTLEGFYAKLPSVG